MVTDCLTPIITEAGAGTIITLDNRNALVDGLRFKKMEIEPFLTTDALQYRIALVDKTTQKAQRWDYAKLKLYLTADVMLFTPNGWKSIESFKTDAESTLIRIYKLRCIVCGKYYMPRRPVQSCCSDVCKTAAVDADMLLFRPITAANAPDIMIEDWAEMTYLQKLYLPKGIHAVRVKKLEDASGIYANGILISLPSLTQTGYNDSNNSEQAHDIRTE